MMQVYTNTQHPICQDLKIKLNLSGGPLWDLQSQGSGLSRTTRHSHWVSVAWPCPAYIRTGHRSRAEAAPCKTGSVHSSAWLPASAQLQSGSWMVLLTVSLTELELLRNYCTPLIMTATMLPERFNQGGTGLGSNVP